MKQKFAPAALLLALVIPACHDGDGGGGGTGAVTLMSDDFSRTTVGSDWTDTSSGGTAAINPATGSPQPGLEMTATQSLGNASVESTQAFATPFTVSVDVQLASVGDGFGGVAI